MDHLSFPFYEETVDVRCRKKEGLFRHRCHRRLSLMFQNLTSYSMILYVVFEDQESFGTIGPLKV